MGWKLRRALAENAPADWTPVERLIAYEIADLCHDRTWRWYSADAHKILERRVGLSWRRIAEMLAVLRDDRGFDFRVALKAGRNGRPVYATRGHRTTYQVPERVRDLAGFDGERLRIMDGKGAGSRTPTTQREFYRSGSASRSTTQRSSELPSVVLARLASSASDRGEMIKTWNNAQDLYDREIINEYEIGEALEIDLAGEIMRTVTGMLGDGVHIAAVINTALKMQREGAR